MTRHHWRRWGRVAIVTLVGLTVLVAGGVELMLRVGPTRPAEFRGKRVVYAATPAGRTYRVSYTYDAAGRRPSDTDRVSYPFFLTARWGSPLRVRTFGWGTFRFARLAGGADPAADGAAAARWAAVAAAGGGLAVLRVRRSRRRVAGARAGGPAAGTGAPPGR